VTGLVQWLALVCDSTAIAWHTARRDTHAAAAAAATERMRRRVAGWAEGGTPPVDVTAGAWLEPAPPPGRVVGFGP
jgi:hypothetical protein